MSVPSNVLEIRYSKIYNKYVKEDIKIGSISDTHISDSISEKEIDFMINTFKKENPNYICVLGDIIDYPRIVDNDNNKNKCIKLFQGLSKISPVYIVLGNHDYINYDKEDKYSENYKKSFWDEVNSIKNVTIIDDKKIVLKDIVLCGYRLKKLSYHSEEDKLFYYDFQNIKELNSVKDIKPKVLLMHSPHPFFDKNNVLLIDDYDLILCGHYHNGCVPPILDKVLSNHRGIIAPSKRLFPKNVRGIKKINNHTYLINNGGWTKVPHNAPKKYRIFDKLCNRQIDITTLTNDKKYENIKIKTTKRKKV